ncbi:MAG: hypothetical protein R3E08_05700 [Thiotrichaceae bacterium]
MAAKLKGFLWNIQSDTAAVITRSILVKAKFERNLATRLSPKKSAKILEICADQATLENLQ